MIKPEHGDEKIDEQNTGHGHVGDEKHEHHISTDFIVPFDIVENLQLAEDLPIGQIDNRSWNVPRELLHSVHQTVRGHTERQDEHREHHHVEFHVVHLDKHPMHRHTTLTGLTISPIITSFGPSRLIAEKVSNVLMYQMDKSTARKILAAQKH